MGVGKGQCKFSQPIVSHALRISVLVHISLVTAAPVSSETILSTETSAPLTRRPSASAEPTTGRPNG